MARSYTTFFSSVACTAQQDFFEILAATGKPVTILEFGLSQETEVQDAAEEQLKLLEKRAVGSVTSGSGGSTHTPQPTDDGDAAAGATVEINNTTKVATGTGSIENLRPHTWNVRVPYRHVYLEKDRPVITPGNRWALGLDTTPADSITASGYVVFEEIGS